MVLCVRAFVRIRRKSIRDEITQTATVNCNPIWLIRILHIMYSLCITQQSYVLSSLTIISLCTSAKYVILFIRTFYSVGIDSISLALAAFLLQCTAIFGLSFLIAVCANMLSTPYPLYRPLFVHGPAVRLSIVRSSLSFMK